MHTSSENLEVWVPERMVSYLPRESYSVPMKNILSLSNYHYRIRTLRFNGSYKKNFGLVDSITQLKVNNKLASKAINSFSFIEDIKITCLGTSSTSTSSKGSLTPAQYTLTHLLLHHILEIFISSISILYWMYIPQKHH
jgi:hypothetical protein